MEREQAAVHRGMSKMDLNKDIGKEAEGASARVSAAAGRQVNVNFGQINASSINRETPMGVEFAMLVPVQMSSGGQTVSATIAAAIGALVGVFEMHVNRAKKSPQS
jgi:hypothetical protein